MYRRRQWSVRHARGLEMLYAVLEKGLVWLDPILNRIGFARLGRPFAALERGSQGLLFDCRMCGQCALSHTSMSCPMNCPKSLRNGPCGGVRQDGGCEVIPEMPCVWVDAWSGSRRMADPSAIEAVQKPVDHRLMNRSSWLRALRQRLGRSDGGTAPAA